MFPIPVNDSVNLNQNLYMSSLTTPVYAPQPIAATTVTFQATLESTHWVLSLLPPPSHSCVLHDYQEIS